MAPMTHKEVYPSMSNGESSLPVTSTGQFSSPDQRSLLPQHTSSDIAGLHHFDLLFHVNSFDFNNSTSSAGSDTSQSGSRARRSGRLSRALKGKKVHSCHDCNKVTYQYSRLCVVLTSYEDLHPRRAPQVSV